MLDFLKGKKTYIVAVLIGVAGVVQAADVIIPEYIWVGLGAIGLGAVRAAMKKIETTPLVKINKKKERRGDRK